MALGEESLGNRPKRTSERIGQSMFLVPLQSSIAGHGSLQLFGSLNSYLPLGDPFHFVKWIMILTCSSQDAFPCKPQQKQANLTYQKAFIVPLDMKSRGW